MSSYCHLPTIDIVLMLGSFNTVLGGSSFTVGSKAFAYSAVSAGGNQISFNKFRSGLTPYCRLAAHCSKKYLVSDERLKNAGVGYSSKKG
jgi:hypothetical protein